MTILRNVFNWRYSILWGLIAWGMAAPLRAGDKTASVMDRVVVAVMEEYYDPARIQPEKMYVAAVAALAEAIPRAVVREENDAVVFEVAGKRYAVRTQRLRSPWAMARAFRKALAVAGAATPGADEETRMHWEYAAVNAMLATLDPHSSAMEPEEWEELRMSTSGEFEGVGIRITTDDRSPCDGWLTVAEVFPNTPAHKAGLRKGDRIERIDGRSTVNITTSEAANRLRGPRGSRVSVTVRHRDGTRETIVIERGRIPIESVTSRMLDGNIGFVRIASFGRTTPEEVEGALQQLAHKGMRGLILDLRDNPGGLLQAAAEVVDTFVRRGTIVSTSGGRAAGDDVFNAHDDGTEPDYPVVVLVNSRSASAAEIVAGALHNLGRALVVGRRTFGKGSVQQLSELPGGGVMRLTIAQYLLPGGTSIQAVGVEPDAVVRPTYLEKGTLRLSPVHFEISESELDAHLTRASTVERGDAGGTALDVPVWLTPRQRAEDKRSSQRCYEEDDDAATMYERAVVRFAQEVLRGTKGAALGFLRSAAAQVTSRWRKEWEKAVTVALRAHRIDWSPPSVQGGAEGKDAPAESWTVRVAVSGEKKQKTQGDSVAIVRPGERVRVTLTVRNTGTAPVYRLAATSASDNPWFRDLDFALGKVPPGAARTWTEEVVLPPVVSPRIDPVRFTFSSQGGPAPQTVVHTVAVLPPSPPRMEVTWSVTEGADADGDGVPEPGESIAVHVAVRNAGKRTLGRGEVRWSSDALDVEKGRIAFDAFRPGDRIRAEFSGRIPKQLRKYAPEATLGVYEWMRDIPRLMAVETMNAAVGVVVPRACDQAYGAVAPAGDTALLLRQAPSEDAVVAAVLPAGNAVPVDASCGNWAHVRWSRGQAWVQVVETRPAAPPDKVVLQPVVWTEPVVELDAQQPVRVDGERDVVVSGKAAHPLGVQDIAVFVAGRKVAYRDAGGRTSVAFSFSVRMTEVENPIDVVVRGSDGSVGRAPWFVRTADD